MRKASPVNIEKRLSRPDKKGAKKEKKKVVLEGPSGTINRRREWGGRAEGKGEGRGEERRGKREA